VSYAVWQALKHGGFKARKDVKLVWVEASSLEPESKEKDPESYEQAWQAVKDADG
jgi:CTP synthase (UTP-ammonia lyase)